MTAPQEVELLPLPELPPHLASWLTSYMRALVSDYATDYARANVARIAAERDALERAIASRWMPRAERAEAERDAARKEVESLKAALLKLESAFTQLADKANESARTARNEYSEAMFIGNAAVYACAAERVRATITDNRERVE